MRVRWIYILVLFCSTLSVLSSSFASEGAFFVGPKLDSLLVLVSEDPERYYAVVTGQPVISTAVAGASIDVVVFISPSCPTCIRLYSSLFISGFLLKNTAFHLVNFSFVLVPRIDDDHLIISSLFCVQPKSVFPAVAEFYRVAAQTISAMSNFDESSMSNLTKKLVSVSESIARSFGTQNEVLKKCQENSDFNDAITAAWVRGWGQNAGEDWPLVVLNGEPTSMKNSVDLIQKLKLMQQ